MFQEYPKSLYLNGEWEGDHVIVHDAEQEAEKRNQGYKMLSEPQEESPKRRRKVSQ